MKHAINVEFLQGTVIYCGI